MRVGRYLAAIALTRSAAVLVLLVAIYAAVDVVETSASFGADVTGALSSYPLRLPTAITQATPLALLVGVLLALASLRKAGEWDALAAAGIAPARLAPWLLAAPLAAAVLCVPLASEIAPRCLERWQAASGARPRSPAGAYQWIATGRTLARCDGTSGCRGGIVVERGEEGLPIGFFAPDGSGLWRVWRRGGGWAQDAARELPPGIAGASHPRNVEGPFPGAGLASDRLAAAIADLKASGRDSSPLEAEQGLRLALALSCLVLPLLGLTLGLTARRLREAGLVALALAAAFVYWFVLAAAWNGAVLGLWPSAWVGPGVPAMFLLLSAVVVWFPRGRRVIA